jgi:hypothetical protein
VAECPFCGSQVTEDLVIYGGTCPRCFAEIPGEEAATDPGEDVKARQDRWDRFRARVPMLLGLLVLTLIVGCTGLTALVVVVWPEPEVAAILDFDALDYPMPDLVGVTDAGGGGATPPEPTSSASAPRPSPRPTSSRPAPERPGPVASTSPHPSGSVDLSLEGPRVRRDDNVVLSDPDAIRDMIGERMVEFIPGLKVCYDRRLKVSPSLRGRWRLSFTVAPSGEVSRAAAVGLDKGDAELESCLKSHVEKNWRFGQITIAQPVQRTIRFYPD